MKHLFSTTLILLILSSITFSQVGSDCANSHLVTSLPFNLTGMTTAGSGDDYDNGSCCGSDYMTGNDYVFEYTPASDIEININLTYTGSLTGLFITKGCPDDINAECIAYDEASGGNPQLSSVELLKDSTYFIIVSTWAVIPLYQTTNFSIEIKESIPFDVGVYTLFFPRSGCKISDTVNVYLKNFGTDTISNFDIAYTVDGGTPVVETCFFIIPPGSEKNISFGQVQPDLSIIGHTYYIEVYAMLPSDGDNTNDTLKRFITHTPSYDIFPYYEDFESGNGGWAADWRNLSGSEFSWELGEPSATIIDTAYSGTNAWTTNLTGNTNINESSFVISPCFDFSSMILPIFDFWIWYETQTHDFIKVEYSLDSSLTWNQLGTITSGINWYNTPGGYTYEGWYESSCGWLNAIHTCDNLGGEPQVQFRVTFDGGVGGTAEGFAFDDVKIYESPLNDLGIVDIIYPEDGCGLSSNEDITIKIANVGLFDQNNFDLSYSIDGGNTFVTETYTNTIISEDTLIFTFATQADLSTIGLLNIIAHVDLLSDSNSNNDTIVKDIFHFNTISTYPYQEDFESNDGGWYAKGFRTSWEHGIPSDSIINSAASGNNAWVTNLSGVSNLGEQSFLYTPCFDFSDLTKPKINFNIWYDVDMIGTKFEYSVNGGQTWPNYGDTSGNWYNNGHNWNYQSNGWVNVERDLYVFAGEPQIQFRFNFTGTNLYSGFAIDDFTICEEPTAGFSHIVNGLEITFTDTSLHGNTYYWDFGDTTSSADQNPVHIYNYTDTVTVTQIVYNDCSNDTTYQYIYVTGINHLSTENFTIFPNPADEEIFIQFNKEMIKILDIEIINIQGKTIIYKSIKNSNSNFIKIPVNSLSAGIYFINIKTSKGIYKKKISID